MKMEESIRIEGSPEATWRVLTDIDRCADVIGGIKEVEVIEQPQSGLVGLKWRPVAWRFLWLGHDLWKRSRLSLVTHGPQRYGRR